MTATDVVLGYLLMIPISMVSIFFMEYTNDLRINILTSREYMYFDIVIAFAGGFIWPFCLPYTWWATHYSSRSATGR